MTFSETHRQSMHIAMGGLAFLLRVLTWWQAALFAAAALLFNLLLLPRVAARRIYRPGELATGLPTGVLFYPLAVLLLVLAFPHRPDVAAAAWAIMAAGDGCATLVGQRLGGRRLPWNADKSIAGTMTFVVAGSVAGMVLAWWTRPAVTPAPPAAFVWGAPVVACVVAALVETLPVRLDDNLSVPAAAGAVLWGLTLVTEEAWAAAAPSVWAALPPAVAINAAAALGGWWAGAVSRSGTIGGAAIGTVVYACAGPAGWTLLFAAFLAATLSSRVGLRRKAVLGIAEAHSGRRGLGNALANTGLAACAALLAVASPHQDAALVAFVAALAAGGSDTIASEIGKAWGRHTVLITTFSRVPPGTSGAISLEGTAAGLVGAFGLAAVGVAGGLTPGAAILPVVAGATLGSLVESALGATLEGPGVLNNDLLNFINTAVSAVAAVTLVGLVA